VIAAVIEQDLTDRRRRVGSRLKLNKQRRGGLNVSDVVRSSGVLPRLPEILRDLITGAQRSAIRELHIGRGDAAEEIRGRAGLDLEYIDAGGDVLAEEVRLGKAEIDLLRAERQHRADPQILAAAEEIALAHADIGERAVRGREPDAKRQFAGRLLFGLDRDDGPIWRRARAVGDLDLLEKPAVLDALLGARHLVG